VFCDCTRIYYIIPHVLVGLDVVNPFFVDGIRYPLQFIIHNQSVNQH